MAMRMTVCSVDGMVDLATLRTTLHTQKGTNYDTLDLFTDCIAPEKIIN